MVSGLHTSPDDPDHILTDYGPKLVTAITDDFWFPAGWLMTFISIWCFSEPPGSVSWLFVMTDDIWSSAFSAVLTLTQIKQSVRLKERLHVNKTRMIEDKTLTCQQSNVYIVFLAPLGSELCGYTKFTPRDGATSHEEYNHTLRYTTV